MKRSLVLLLALALISVLAIVVPAGATHTVPITITVQSTYAGLCGANPGPNNPVPGAWTGSLIANEGGASTAFVPNDLWGTPTNPFGNVSGACTYGIDPIWNVTRAARATTDCDPPAQVTGCRGLHYPGVGPPVQPGRFLNFANHSSTPDAKNFCMFVSTGTPNQGTCTSLAIGYTFAVGVGNTSDTPIEGSYCGTSRGFGWAMAASNSSLTANPTWTVIEWIPTSAGSLLPLSGIVTDPNWQPNAHYSGWAGTAGKPTMRMNGTKNVFGLTTARSYISGVDNESTTPGSCGSTLNNGGVQFFNQSVVVGLGD